jgi:hypothetical protein
MPLTKDLLPGASFVLTTLYLVLFSPLFPLNGKLALSYAHVKGKKRRLQAYIKQGLPKSLFPGRCFKGSLFLFSLLEFISLRIPWALGSRSRPSSLEKAFINDPSPLPDSC